VGREVTHAWHAAGMRIDLALPLCLVLACNGGPVADGSSPEPADAAEPGKPELAKSEPTKPELAKPGPEQPAPANDTPTAKTPVVREAGVPAPASKTILALARAAKLGSPASAATPEPFGPRRHVAVVRTRTGAGPARFALHALLLTLPEADDAEWQLERSIELFAWSREWYEDDEPEAGKIPTTIQIDDYDDDGEPELLVRFRDQIMCSGGGENLVTTLQLVELSETPPRIALQTEIDHALSNGAVQTRTKVVHEDLDHDGHRDLKIEYRLTAEGEDPTEDQRRWRWDPATDAWVRLSSDGSWKDNQGASGCDW